MKKAIAKIDEMLNRYPKMRKIMKDALIEIRAEIVAINDSEETPRVE